MRTINQTVETTFVNASIKDVIAVMPVMNFLFGALAQATENNVDTIRVTLNRGETCVLHKQELDAAYKILSQCGFMSQNDAVEEK